MRTAAQIVVSALLLCVAIGGSSQKIDDREFLSRATDRVSEYAETFNDLTAEETTTFRLVDRWGTSNLERTLVSSLIIYRSQTKASMAVEYRDVESVDGKQVKDRSKRALKLMDQVSDAKSVIGELERITKEGSRYNHDFVTINVTLHEAIPLMLKCRHAFTFAYVGDEVVRGLATRVYSYEQVTPCVASTYDLSLPLEYEEGHKWHRGTLWLETSTARVVQEERTVFATSTKDSNLRAKVLNIWFSYATSKFGILVPSNIVITRYAFTGTMSPSGPVTAPRRIVTQSYGPFSRFEVSTQQHVIYPDDPDDPHR